MKPQVDSVGFRITLRTIIYPTPLLLMVLKQPATTFILMSLVGKKPEESASLQCPLTTSLFVCLL